MDPYIDHDYLADCPEICRMFNINEETKQALMLELENRKSDALYYENMYFEKFECREKLWSGMDELSVDLENFDASISARIVERVAYDADINGVVAHVASQKIALTSRIRECESMERRVSVACDADLKMWNNSLKAVKNMMKSTVLKEREKGVQDKHTPESCNSVLSQYKRTCTKDRIKHTAEHALMKRDVLHFTRHYFR